jgi:hypothetical protein
MPGLDVLTGNRFESREICNEIIKNFHGIPVGEECLALQVRYADTSAQKRLKATTTKKRQFRSNEYNSVVNTYYNQPHMPYGPASHFRNRVWMRQNSFSSNGSVFVFSPSILGQLADSSSALEIQT